MKKKIFSLLLVLAMLFGMIPVISACAAGSVTLGDASIPEAPVTLTPVDLGGGMYTAYGSATEAQYTAYLSTLTSNGYTALTASHKVQNVDYAIYQKDTQTLYLEWQPAIDYETTYNGSTGIVTTSSAGNYVPSMLRVTYVKTANAFLPDPAKPTFTAVCDTKGYLVGTTQVSGGYANGMSVFYLLADGTFLVYDGGRNANDAYNLYNLLSGVAAEYNLPGITVSAWVITHPHDDHMGFWTSFAGYKESVTVKKVFFTYDKKNSDGSSAKVLSGAAAMGAPVYSLHAGQSFYLADVKVDVIFAGEDLAPIGEWKGSTDANLAGNADSTVMKLTFSDGRTVLMTGDASYHVWDYLASAYGAAGLKSDFLQTPHHATWYGGTAKTYEMVAPSTVLWSCDKGLQDLSTTEKKVGYEICRSVRDNPNFTNILAGYFDPATGKVDVTNFLTVKNSFTPVEKTGDEKKAQEGYVCRIGDAATGTYYKTFDEAYLQAKGSVEKVITLIADTTSAGGDLTGSLTVNGNGKTLTLTGATRFYQNSGEYKTITDMHLANAGTQCTEQTNAGGFITYRNVVFSRVGSKNYQLVARGRQAFENCVFSYENQPAGYTLFHLAGNYSPVIEMTNCTINAPGMVYYTYDASSKPTLRLSGNNTFNLSEDTPPVGTVETLPYPVSYYVTDAQAKADGAVCRIGAARDGKYFRNLNDAYRSVTADCTVTLLADATLTCGDQNDVFATSFTVDGQNHTIKSSTRFKQLSGVTQTLKNLTLEMTSATMFSQVETGATLTCENVTFKTANASTYNFVARGTENFKNCVFNVSGMTGNGSDLFYNDQNTTMTFDGCTFTLAGNTYACIVDSATSGKTLTVILKGANSVTSPLCAFQIANSTAIFKGTGTLTSSNIGIVAANGSNVTLQESAVIIAAGNAVQTGGTASNVVITVSGGTVTSTGASGIFEDRSTGTGRTINISGGTITGKKYGINALSALNLSGTYSVSSTTAGVAGINVFSDTALTVNSKAVNVDVAAVKGASARIKENSSGLRFAGTVTAADVAELNALKSAGTITGYTYNTVIFKDYDSLDGKYGAAEVMTSATAKTYKITATNGINTDADGNVTFNAALINFSTENYETDFGTIASIELTLAGGSVLSVSTFFNPTDNLRSVKGVAQSALAAEASAPGTYTASQITILQNYVNGVSNYNP